MPSPRAALDLRRPGTLAEAAATFRINDADTDFRTALAGFLDTFYMDPDCASQRKRLEREPARTGDARCDAYIGAIGDHLCRRWILGEPPRWVDKPWRFLKEPWFLGADSMKAIYLQESPSAFRARFIFTEAEPLRRARMPRDGRWWYYEALRTGMTPGSDDVAPGRTAAR